MEESVTEESKIFGEIKAAENEAEQVIGDAEKECQRLLEQAKKGALAIVSESIGKSKANSERRLLQLNEELLKEKEKEIARGKNATLAIVKMAEKNVPKASLYIVEKLMQRLKC